MSDNYLPEIVSPEPDTQSDGERDYGEEGGMSFHDGGDGVDEGNVEVEIKEEPEIIPDEKPKKKLSNEEVFKTPKVKEIKPILIEEEKVEEKPKKKKRQMSEKQLQHLARIREKGQKALKEKRELDKKLKSEGKKPPPSKRSTKKVKETDVEIQVSHTPNATSLSKQDVEDITTNAIDRYEVKRKKRKEEKKEKEKKENHQQKVSSTIQKALGQEPDIWGNALKGMYGN
jgi:hypothetical protein